MMRWDARQGIVRVDRGRLFDPRGLKGCVRLDRRQSVSEARNHTDVKSRKNEARSGLSMHAGSLNRLYALKM
jgi:hypothetical protein